MEGYNISAFMAGWCSAFFTLYAIRLLYKGREKPRFHRVLGWILVVWACFNMKDIVLTFPQFYRQPILNYVMLIDGWSALTFAVFINEIVTPGWATARRLTGHAVPFFLFTVAYVVTGSEWVIRGYVVFLWFYAWTIVIDGILKARKYLKYIQENYSNIDEIDISWLRPVFFFAIVSQLSWLATSLAGHVVSDIFYYISTIIMWAMVLHYSHRFSPIVMEPPVTTPPTREFTFEEELKKAIDEDEVYLNRDLTLGELATLVGTNRTYLSSYLGQKEGLTFYDYINRLRITRKGVPLIQSHPEYTLEHIAAESGFNSISTFRRAFTKLMGKSPRDYRQSTR